MSAAPINILLVEDNEDDVFAMQRALRRGNIAHSLQIASDGQKAVDYFSGTGPFADRSRYPLPTLVFLDLKLPYIDGFEVLSWLRLHVEFNALPVIMLTSSAEERDQERAFSLGAKSYLVKPPTPAALQSVCAAFASEVPLLRAGLVPGSAEGQH